MEDRKAQGRQGQREQAGPVWQHVLPGRAGPFVFRQQHAPLLGSAPGLPGGDLAAPRGLLAKFLIGKNGVFTAQSSSTTRTLHRTLKHFALVLFVGESFVKRLRVPLGFVVAMAAHTRAFLGLVGKGQAWA